MNNPEVTTLVRWGRIALVILVVFLAVETVSAIGGLNAPREAYNSITVSGTGKATSTPDIATFSFSVSADAPVVADAQNKVNDKMGVIVADLKKMDIADKDIDTSGYSVYPKYVYAGSTCSPEGPCLPGKQTLDGYTASESVTVKVRNTADAGQALTVAGKDGATDISGLSFTLDDPEAPMNAARNEAIADAKSKADTLAKELGVHLVRVIGYNDNGDGGIIRPLYATSGMAKADSSVAPTLPIGEDTVNASVNVTYEIR